MLLGKLATPAMKVVQNGVFDATSIYAEYMVVSARKFVIGAKNVSFEIRFGNVLLENEQERFDIVLREYITILSEDLVTWGIDDSILLDIIAAKLGTTLIEKMVKDLHYTY